MRIELADGVRLYVDVDGPGLVPEGPTMLERPTVILLHGGPGADHSVFKGTPLGTLTDVAQVVYYDHRGNGRSDAGTPEDWNLDTWADDVVRLCDALSIEKPIVIGASFGGMVAQRYIGRHPEHPSKVVLCCTSATLDLDRIETAFTKFGGPEAGAAARRFWMADPEALADYMRLCMPLYSVNEHDFEMMLRGVMKLDVLAHFQHGEQHTMDNRAGLAAATCPVLVIAGDLDPVTPIEANEEVAACLPSALVRFETIAGASHIDIPGETGLELIRDFIRS